MKLTRADGSVIDGTPDEIAAYEALQKMHNAAATKQDASSHDGNDPNNWEYVSTDVAFRAITRIKLGKETKAVIKRIYIGGDAWTTAAALQKEVDYSPSQFAGLMGAFGRRLVNTPGYVHYSSFFEQEWDDNKSCYKYRLPMSVRVAVEKANVVS